MTISELQSSDPKDGVTKSSDPKGGFLLVQFLQLCMISSAYLDLSLSLERA